MAKSSAVTIRRVAIPEPTKRTCGCGTPVVQVRIGGSLVGLCRPCSMERARQLDTQADFQIANW